MDTPVEGPLFQIIHCYHQQAAREGDMEALLLEELKALLMDNVPHFMESLATRAQRPHQMSQHADVRSHLCCPCHRAGDVDTRTGPEEAVLPDRVFWAADDQICFDEPLYVLGKLLTDDHLQYHRQLCAHYRAQHSLYQRARRQPADGPAGELQGQLCRVPVQRMTVREENKATS
ncbi:Protein S100-A15A [Camelus dromedarius]|uniref:Protein S100-A15A n=1 Tax=Camelus dromedarius TaxID=9838 RepID=A0A5N4CMQ0_CAMDR|nr:protein S100-A15A-like [Camelus dromedarius]KAB1260201.1 Protein S100-A15A [Camelus dromedarius]